MGEHCDTKVDHEELESCIPAEAIDAVARSMYGEAEFDALADGDQAKTATANGPRPC